jgi:hypothetical protein
MCVARSTSNTSNKRAEPELTTDESSSDEVVMPLDEVVLLVEVEGVTALQIRARPRRSRGVNRKDDDATTRAYKTTCKAQQGQVNKSAVTLGLVLGEEEGAVQLAPLWHVQGVSSEEAYRVVPAVPQLRVSHAAIVSGLRCEKDLAFKRPLENRVVPFAVYSISLNWVAGVEALAAQRVSTNAS